MYKAIFEGTLMKNPDLNEVEESLKNSKTRR